MKRLPFVLAFASAATGGYLLYADWKSRPSGRQQCISDEFGHYDIDGVSMTDSFEVVVASDATPTHH